MQVLHLSDELHRRIVGQHEANKKRHMYVVINQLTNTNM